MDQPPITASMLDERRRRRLWSVAGGDRTHELRIKVRICRDDYRVRSLARLARVRAGHICRTRDVGSILRKSAGGRLAGVPVFEANEVPTLLLLSARRSAAARRRGCSRKSKASWTGERRRITLERSRRVLSDSAGLLVVDPVDLKRADRRADARSPLGSM